MTMVENGQDNALVRLFASLELTLGSLKKAVDDSVKWRKQAKRFVQPVFYTYADQAVIASNFGVARLTGPDQGHIWYIRGIGLWFPVNGVGGAAAGTADMFVSAADHRSKTALTQFSGVDWRDHFSTLPAVRQYSTGQIPLRFNEELYIAFSGASTGTPYAATIWLEDFEEAALEAGWAL